MRKLTLGLLLPFLLAVPIACSDEDGGPGPDPPMPDRYPDATTADILIDNFVRAYEEKNFAEYSKLIHPEFQFFFSPEDVDQLELSDPGWDRVAELSATRNMFEGNPGFDSDGNRVPGIVKIEMMKLDDTVDVWLPAQGEPLYEGTLVRRYRFNLNVTYAGVSTPVQVRGIQELYVESDDVDGQMIFRMKFWKDLGADVGGRKFPSEQESWGMMKFKF